MKKLILCVLAAGFLLTGCNQGSGAAKATDSATTAANAPIMKFQYDNHDFGKIQEGDKVNYKFSFTNTGKSPLIISSAVASCGCTTPEWPKGPIKPGDGGLINVTFNSTGKKGLQDKMITITANTNPPQNVVHLIGEVLDKK
jgi:predicted small secreted protein